VLDATDDPHSIAAKILEVFTVTVVPVINPDGFTYSHEHSRLWKKNRQNVGGLLCKGEYEIPDLLAVSPASVFGKNLGVLGVESAFTRQMETRGRKPAMAWWLVMSSRRLHTFLQRASIRAEQIQRPIITLSIANTEQEST